MDVSALPLSTITMLPEIESNVTYSEELNCSPLSGHDLHANARAEEEQEIDLISYVVAGVAIVLITITSIALLIRRQTRKKNDSISK